MDCPQDDREIGDDLRITKITRQAAGRGIWACGTLAGHRFDALVFPEHAENPGYEMGTSRISKLYLLRLATGEVVLNFDRGWDVKPQSAEAAAIMDFLAAGLAEMVYGR